MADESDRSQEAIEEQQEVRRAARRGARSARDAAQELGRAMRREADETAHGARVGFERAGQRAGQITQELTEDMERVAAGMTEDAGEMLHELTRLATLPQLAARGFQAAQEIGNALMRAAVETNLQIVSEITRTLNPALLLRTQQRLARHVVHGMVEQGTDIVQTSRRFMRESLEPMDESYAGRHPQGRRVVVGDVMSRDLKIARPDYTVEMAARLMDESDIGALPVGDNDHLVGMLTDRDIALGVAARGRDPQKTQVREIMSEDVEACHENDPLDHVLRRMSEEKIRRLPVLDHADRPVGMISLDDLAARHSPEQAGQALRSIASSG